MSGYASPAAAEAPAREDLRRRWTAAAAVLAAGVLTLALVFRPEEAEAVRVWLGSTAYNHCFLVLPVALYLAWDRRQVMATVSPRPAPWIALAALPVALCWLLAERAGIWEARQLLAMSLLQILFLAVLGPRGWRALSAPLLYLFFLVPAGGFLIPALQSFTVHFMKAGLNVLGIPNYVSGTVIEIPEGTFRVAQACAGLRFLIASVAFGALYGCLMYTSVVRRLLFMGLSLVVPVIANGFRALGLVVLAHLLDSAAAVETDHILYGWLFFSIVTFALILIGLPFRQVGHRPVAAGKPGRRGPLPALAAAAAAAVILTATAPRLLADRLDSLAEHPLVAAGLRFPVPPDCTPAPLPAGAGAAPSIPVPGVARSRAYRCSGGVFVVTVRRYPARISGRRLLVPTPPASLKRGPRARLTRIFDTGGGATAQRWKITEFVPGDTYDAVASALWIDGRPALGGIRSRLRQAVNALSPEAVSPVAVTVSYATTRGPADGRRAIDRFLSGAATVWRGIAGGSAADAGSSGVRRRSSLAAFRVCPPFPRDPRLRGEEPGGSAACPRPSSA
jgi:exosortase A